MYPNEDTIPVEASASSPPLYLSKHDLSMQRPDHQAICHNQNAKQHAIGVDGYISIAIRCLETY